MKRSDLSTKLPALVTKAKLKAEQDKIMKLVFDLSYICGKSHFEEDGTQNYLILLRVCIHISKRLQKTIIFQFRNQKSCLTKVLNFMFHLIIVLLHH